MRVQKAVTLGAEDTGESAYESYLVVLIGTAGLIPASLY